MTKVSIIIPIFKVEKYLSSCLDSCINQTLQDIEIICVNDNSPDNSMNILEKYIHKDSRIKIISHEKNQGLAVTRNTGLNNSTGDYVLFLDSDDLLPLDTCEKMYNHAITNNADLVVGDFFQFYDFNIPTEKPKSRTPEFSEFYKQKEELIDPKNLIEKSTFIQFYQQLYFMVVWMKLYKRSIFIDNNIIAPPLRCAEDFIMVKDFLFHCKTISFIDDIVIYYRKHADGFTSSKNNYCFDIFNSYKPAIEMFKKNGYLQKEFNNIQAFYLQAYIAHLENFCPLYLVPQFMWKMHKEIKLWNTEHINHNVLSKKEEKELKIYKLPTIFFIIYKIYEIIFLNILKFIFNVKNEFKNNNKYKIIKIFGIKIKIKIKKVVE